MITDDTKEADAIATILFFMPVEDGKTYVETLKNVEAIWYQNDNTIEYSSGLK